MHVTPPGALTCRSQGRCLFYGKVSRFHRTGSSPSFIDPYQNIGVYMVSFSNILICHHMCTYIRSTLTSFFKLFAAQVAAGVPRERIVVAGFSQGGHVALKTALLQSQPLAACVGLSTWCELTHPVRTPLDRLHSRAHTYICILC